MILRLRLGLGLLPLLVATPALAAPAKPARPQGARQVELPAKRTAKPRPAPKVRIGFLGPAREISHSSSASRDTALLQMIIAPYPTLTAGGDFSLFSIRFAGMTWRLGFFGMLELESGGRLPDVSPIIGDIHYWRGLYGFSLAVSMDRLARRWLGPGSALEITLSGRHESEHQTADNFGGASTDYSDVYHINNFLMPDLALRWRVGPVSLVARLQWKAFIGLKNYRHGPGGDLIARWHAYKWIHPFVSVFGEYVFGSRLSSTIRVPDHYLVRGLLGIIVPSRGADLYIFMSGDVGHRKGLAVYSKVATLGCGFRVAFY